MTKCGDIIILHMYGSWDMEHKSQIFFFDMYHKWKSYDVWFLRCGAWQSEFFVILGHFWPFTPLTTKKIKIKKKKKMPGDIVTLHMCTIYDDHMMYGSWDMVHNRQIFLSFWTIFCPFTPLTTWEIMKYGAQ